MIQLEEILLPDLDEFWSLHIKYLIEDGIINDEEDISYFSGTEYRGMVHFYVGVHFPNVGSKEI